MISNIIETIAYNPDIRASQLCKIYDIDVRELLRILEEIRNRDDAYDKILLMNNRFMKESCALIGRDGNRIEELLTGKRKFPLILEFHPGPFCNNKCDWCFSIGEEYNECETGKKTLSFGKFLDILDECKLNGVEEIWFSGGKEPFTNKDTIRFIASANNRGFKTRVYTNGTLLRFGHLSILLGCKQIRISINAATKKTYAKIAGANEDIFGDLWEMITDFTRLKYDMVSDAKICVSFLIQNDNYHEMIDFYKLALISGVDSVQFRLDSIGRCKPLSDIAIKEIVTYSMNITDIHHDRKRNMELDLRGIGENELGGNLLPDLKRPTKCFAGKIKRGISPFGIVYNCEFASHPHFKNCSDHLILGDVNINSMTDIMNNAKDFYPVCDFCQAHEYGMNILLGKLKDDLDFGIPVDTQIFNRRL